MDDQYDEFGNYIGEEIPSEVYSSSKSSIESLEESEKNEDGFEVIRVDNKKAYDQIVLHEDKKYYPNAEEIYGSDVEVLVEEEDRQLLTEPIVKPVDNKKFSFVDQNIPETIYNSEYLFHLVNTPEFVRNIAFVGNIHSGKTSFLDALIKKTHLNLEVSGYADTLYIEKELSIGTKCTPISLILPDMRGKSQCLNIIDVPGHINFIDEASAALRLCDGVILFIDVTEGVTLTIEKLIKLIFQENLVPIICLNKIDRLVLELKLPPSDAYFKLKSILNDVNKIFQSFCCGPVSPLLGNVFFASGYYNMCFSLESFASLYAQEYPGTLDSSAFAKRLWGNVYFDKNTRKFSKKAEDSKATRTFVQFILEPLYKIFSSVVGDVDTILPDLLSSLKISLERNESKKNVKPLLQTIFKNFFEDFNGFVEQCTYWVPSSREPNIDKLKTIYTGPFLLDDVITKSLSTCDDSGPLLIHITKLFPSQDGTVFYSFGRVFSGTIHSEQQVKVLGQSYTPEDQEDSKIVTVGRLWILQARYKISVPYAKAGSWVLIEGVDESIMKTATIVNPKMNHNIYIFKPLEFVSSSVIKIAIEPINPSELPKILTGLRKIYKSYPMLNTRVEESGEHIIMGSGELYLDCALHDLRRMYSHSEARVSDPVVTFSETVVETSSLKCFVETPNKKNKITIIAEPLEKKIFEDIENDKLKPIISQFQEKSSSKTFKNEVCKYFKERYDWDVLAARSIWAFGPEHKGSNILMDDTLPSEVDKEAITGIKEYIVQGFQWATREGPLCEEPIRNTNFKLLDCSVAKELIHRAGGQIIPTTRRAIYSSFLLATPRLMEPYYYIECQGPSDCIAPIYTILGRRRGHVIQEIPLPGSPLYCIKAYLPVIDSFGFETDLRAHTQGQAFMQAVFNHWQIVPGDPLDSDIVIRPLEPQPASHLAREFMIKTRKRKGLNEDVSIDKFFDDPMLLKLAKESVVISYAL